MLSKRIEHNVRLSMAQRALEALTAPGSEPDKSFAYGRAVGFAQGMEEALRLVLTVLHEDERRELLDDDQF